MSLKTKLLQNISRELSLKLGEGFELITPENLDAHPNLSFEGDPDIAIVNRENQKVILLGITGSKPSDDLPLAAVSAIRRLQKQNQDKANVILVSISHIAPEIKKQLEESDIAFIESAQENAIVSSLSNLIVNR